MSKQQQLSPTSISTKEMRKAIQNSGYLIEQRVEVVFEKYGYYVESNPAFQDPFTGKSREYDIFAMTAIKLYRESYHYIYPVIICECENNRLPIVFFTKEPLSPEFFIYEVKYAGIPVKAWYNKSFIELSEFLSLNKFHHYCKGSIATQYCTFQYNTKKGDWIALHTDEQHNSFSSLILALESRIEKFYKDWVPSDENEVEIVNIEIFYPLLILQGPIYSAELKSGRLSLKKVKHISFRKEIIDMTSKEPINYQIDVVCESFLSEYLEMVRVETNQIKQLFQRKKRIVLNSINRIVKEARKLEGTNSYRTVLEF